MLSGSLNSDADAALLQRLQAAYLSARSDEAKLLRYHKMGLNQQEIGRLTGLSADVVRQRLKKLALLGLTDYRPDSRLAEAGKLGIAAMRRHQAFAAAQQSLGLEG